jgi:hypothetical protein
LNFLVVLRFWAAGFKRDNPASNQIEGEGEMTSRTAWWPKLKTQIHTQMTTALQG